MHNEKQWSNLTTGAEVTNKDELQALLRNTSKEPLLLIRSVEDANNSTQTKYDCALFSTSSPFYMEKTAAWTKDEAVTNAITDFFTDSQTDKVRKTMKQKLVHICMDSDLHNNTELLTKAIETTQDFLIQIHKSLPDVIDTEIERARQAAHRCQQLKPQKDTMKKIAPQKKKSAKKQKKNIQEDNTSFVVSLNTSESLMFTDNRPLEELTTYSKSSIDNLSPLVVDFITNKQGKHLFLFFPPTGSGKTYSFNALCNYVIENRNLYEQVNKVFFISDRVKTCEDTVADLKKLSKKAESQAVIIHRDIENLRLAKEEFFALEHTAPIIAKLDGYQQLKEGLCTLWHLDPLSNQMKKLAEESVQRHYKLWKDKIVSWLSENDQYKKLTPAERVRFLANNKDYNYSILPVLFPAMWIYEKKFIYMTISKFHYSIDTLVGERALNLYNNKTEMNNSLVFIDEADTAADIFLNRIIEESTSADVDITLVVETMAPRILKSKFSPEVASDSKIISMLQELKDSYAVYEEKYHVGCARILDDTSSSFMYRDHTEVYGPNENDKYHVYDRENNSVKIVNKQSVGKAPCTSNKEYIKESTLLKDAIFNIVKRMTELALKENPNRTQNDEISSLLKRFGIVDENTINAIIRHIACQPQITTLEEKGDCYFINPGGVQKQEWHENARYNTSTVENSMATTPENILMAMINRNAYVILSSATANIPSLRNFCLEWDRLKNEMYHPTQHAVELEKEFLDSRNVGLDKVKRDIVVTEILECKLEQYFTKEVFGQNTEEADKFLALVKQKLKRGSNKDRDPEESKQYYYREYLKLVNNLLEINKTGFYAQLVLYKFCPDFEGPDEALSLLIEKIKTIIPDLEVYTTRSKDITSKVQKFHEAQQQGRKAILMTSYATAEKGINLQVQLPVNDKEVVVLGKNTNKTSQQIPVEIDIDSVFLGNITHILPSEDVSVTDDNAKTVAHTLNTAYTCKKLEYTNEMTADETKEAIKKAMNKHYTASPLKSEIRQSKAGVGSVLRTMIQSVGRMFRCNRKRPVIHIAVDGDIVKTFDKAYYRQHFLDDDFYNKQNCVVQELIDMLFSTKSKTVAFEDTKIKQGNDEINRVLSKISQPGNSPEKQKAIAEYETIFKLQQIFFDSSQGFSKLAKSLVFNCAAYGIKDAYSFEIIGEDEYGNANIGQIGPKGIFPNEVSIAALRLQPFQKTILEKKGFCFEKQSGNWALTPKGFESLKGRIGEALLSYYLTTMGMLSSDKSTSLPPEVYEVMDFVKEEKDRVLVFDAKYYTILSRDHDRKELVEKYREKLRKVSEYYGKKVVGFVINTRYNEEAVATRKYEMHTENFDDQMQLHVVPNIYVQDGFDGDILQKIFKAYSN